MEIVLVLHNIRSAYNVGAILRTAEGFGISKVICSGYTPWFRRPGLLPHLSSKLRRQIQKSALGAEELVSVEWVENLAEKLAELKSSGFLVAGLENNLDRPTVLLSNPSLKSILPAKVVLVLGEEVEGIPVEIRDVVDLFLEIPMRGQKESFNVSVAAGIALFRLTTLNDDI